MQSGFEDTPYVKGSKRKSARKGTGRGVCSVTRKKHEFLWVRTSERPYYGKLFGWGRVTNYFYLVRYCVDCAKYDRRGMKVFSGTADECREKVCAFLGESWGNILWVELEEKDRL